MADVSSENIYDEFLKVADAGDELAAKDFLITYLKLFPEKEKTEIIAAFFDDAVKNGAADAIAVSDFQKQALETVDGLGVMKKKLEDKDKLLQIKETI
jgi:hypothetical protein